MTFVLVRGLPPSEVFGIIQSVSGVGEQRVRGPVAVRSDLWRCALVQSALFEGEVGVYVDLC